MTRELQKRTGRRPKFKVVDMVEAIRKSGGFHTEASRLIAQKTGLSCAFNTVKRYIERYPVCREAFDETQEAMGDMVESQILKGCREGNPTLLIWYSKTKLKHRGYVEKVEVAGEVDHIHQHEHHVIIQSLWDALEAEIEGHAATLQITDPAPKLITGHAKRSNGSGGNGSSSVS